MDHTIPQVRMQINSQSTPAIAQYYMTTSSEANIPTTTAHYSLPGFDALTSTFVPTTTGSMDQWNPGITANNVNSGYARSPEFTIHEQPWLASFGDEYSRYLHQAYGSPQTRMPSLSQQQQLELMASLEQAQLPDVSGLVSDSTTFYRAGLP